MEAVVGFGRRINHSEATLGLVSDVLKAALESVGGLNLDLFEVRLEIALGTEVGCELKSGGSRNFVWVQVRWEIKFVWWGHEAGGEVIRWL